MSHMQSSEGGSQTANAIGLGPRFRSCQTPIQTWLVNYLHQRLHLNPLDRAVPTFLLAMSANKR